jgi:MoxR-like ATPase
LNDRVAALLANLNKVILGKESALRLVISCLLGRGHLLIEDVPGVGKTMLARTLARSIDARFRRVQCTPDLLPSDITGVSVFHPTQQAFEFHQGPVFTHILLADEINRASPRTQSSLLECMEESQVTVDGTTHPLEQLFFVVATQNPIELDGTYPLPEAQLDRFLMRIRIGYPDPEEECRVLSDRVLEQPIEHVEPVLDLEQLLDLQAQVRAVHVGAEIQRYIVELVNASRAHPDVRIGISPRGGLSLMRASQAYTFVHGGSFVTPDAVRAMAAPVLAHRLILDPHREHAGVSKADVVGKLIERTTVPTVPTG